MLECLIEVGVGGVGRSFPVPLRTVINVCLPPKDACSSEAHVTNHVDQKVVVHEKCAGHQVVMDMDISPTSAEDEGLYLSIFRF